MWQVLAWAKHASFGMLPLSPMLSNALLPLVRKFDVTHFAMEVCVMPSLRSHLRMFELTMHQAIHNGHKATETLH